MMKIVCLLLITLFTLSSELCAKPSFFAVVTKIIDGDSIVVKKKQKNIEIRLYGIDCPEWDQPFSGEAKIIIKTLIYKKKVMVIPLYNDSYGRLVAMVSRNGQSINERLVESGAAWVYSKYCRKKICKKWQNFQKRAKAEEKGLWKIKNSISPWRWKRMRHD